MHRFIVWFNCFKARFKSKRFIIPIIFALTFLFLPNTAFAVGESNTVTTTTQEFYWHGINAGGVEETQRFNSTQNHFYKWGTSTANYQLIRFAPLIHFNSFGVDTSYKARIAFYVVTKYPFNYNNKFCTAWSGNGEKYSCSLYKEFEDQTGSNEVMLTFVYDYEWTSSTNYIEFWLNFDNFTTRPNDTEFGYTIIDFQGNVSGNQIILDGLGQTNEKLDEVKDIINNNFNKCYKNELKPFDFADTSQNGVSIKNNGNGTFTLNGTATSYTSFYMQTLSLTPNIYYTLSGGYNDNGILQIIDYKNNPSTLSNGTVTFYNTESSGYLYIVIFEGTTLNNVVFKPMLVKGEEQLSFVAPGKENCINRMDETNQKLDDLNNSLNNDDVSGATSTGNDFFDNFNSKDNGGISRIVTMPLTLINGLISGGTCSNLEFEVLGKEVFFPSGCILWQNAPSAIVTIYRTIICGLFSYILATHLFKDIEDLKNPNKEEVSTLDL